MNQQLKKGVIELIILKLVKNNEMYGYEISQYINEYIKFKESSIYIVLSRLESNNYISIRKAKSKTSNKIVKYFMITDQGLEYLESLDNEWNKIIELTRIVTEEK